MLVAVFLGTLGLLVPPSLFGITVFDEGFIVTGAMQVLDGKLPYRDFLSLYGPGQFYLTALLFAMFGEGLIVAHIAHAALLAGLAVTVFELSRVASHNRRMLPLVMALAYAGIVLYAQQNVGYPSISASLALFLAALPLGKWVQERRQWLLGMASALVGVAGTLRWDFGLFGLIALAVTVATLLLQSSAGSKRWLALAFCAIGPALGIMAAVYVPLVVIVSDPGRWYQEVLRYSVVEFPKWRSLDFVRPAFWSFVTSWRDGDANQFSRSVLRLAYVVLPVSSALATLGIAGSRFVRQKKYLPDRASAQSLFLCVLTVFLLNQMRVRPTLWQGFPAVVACLPLLSYVLNLLPGSNQFGAAMRTACLCGGFVLGAFLFYQALQEWMHAVDRRVVALNMQRAAGVGVTRDWSYYGELVNYVRSKTHDGEPIYSGVSDHSRLFANDPMLYFLSDRSPADRFVELEPGIANTRSAQQEIIEALMKKSVRIVILLDIDSNEPNLTSVSNGVHDLDIFLTEHYRPSRQFGPYTVLEAK